MFLLATGFNSLESVGCRPLFCTMWALHGLLACPPDMAAGFPRAKIHPTETEMQKERDGSAGHRRKSQCLLGCRLRINRLYAIKSSHTQGEEN